MVGAEDFQFGFGDFRQSELGFEFQRLRHPTDGGANQGGAPGGFDRTANRRARRRRAVRSRCRRRRWCGRRAGGHRPRPRSGCPAVRRWRWPAPGRAADCDRVRTFEVVGRQRRGDVAPGIDRPVQIGCRHQQGEGRGRLVDRMTQHGPAGGDDREHQEAGLDRAGDLQITDRRRRSGCAGWRAHPQRRERGGRQDVRAPEPALNGRCSGPRAVCKAASNRRVALCQRKASVVASRSTALLRGMTAATRRALAWTRAMMTSARLRPARYDRCSRAPRLLLRHHKSRERDRKPGAPACKRRHCIYPCAVFATREDFAAIPTLP